MDEDGSINPADADKPVVHVSLKEAMLFCAHYGKHPPHTRSHAAQGSDGRVFPCIEAGEKDSVQQLRAEWKIQQLLPPPNTCTPCCTLPVATPRGT